MQEAGNTGLCGQETPSRESYDCTSYSRSLDHGQSEGEIFTPALAHCRPWGTRAIAAYGPPIASNMFRHMSSPPAKAKLAGACGHVVRVGVHRGAVLEQGTEEEMRSSLWQTVLPQCSAVTVSSPQNSTHTVQHILGSKCLQNTGHRQVLVLDNTQIERHVLLNICSAENS